MSDFDTLEKVRPSTQPSPMGRPTAESAVPSPLVGEGQGEG